MRDDPVWKTETSLLQRLAFWTALDQRRHRFWATILPCCLFSLPFAAIVSPKSLAWSPAFILLFGLNAMSMEEARGWIRNIGAFRVLAIWAIYGFGVLLFIGDFKIGLIAIAAGTGIAFYSICNWHLAIAVPERVWSRNAVAFLAGFTLTTIITILLLTAVLKFTWVHPYAHLYSVYYNRTAVFIALLAPAAYTIAGSLDRRPLLLTSCIATLVLLNTWLSASETSKICSIVGLLAVVIWRYRPRVAIPLAAVSITVTLLGWLPAAVWISERLRAVQFDPDAFGSLRTRVDYYAHAAILVQQAPFFGRGPNTLTQLHIGPDGGALEEGMTAHPHSAIAQIWLDGGTLAVAAVLATIFFVFSRMRDMPALRGEAMFATLLVFLTGWAVSHGLWQNWYHGMAGLAFAAGGLVRHPPRL
jgi:O-Antigen ligase